MQAQQPMPIMPATQDCVAAFCEYYGVDEHAADDAALSSYVCTHAQELNGLIDGYQAMAALNEEICGEFAACESEADSDIR